jgi:SMP-30/gluconolaconase/LRE-like protein
MWHGQIEGTDIAVLDSRFKTCFAGHVRAERLWSGARWAEGPAWFAAGRYLVWSDIPNNRMMRLVEPSGEVSVFRERSNNSNGNTVDNQGPLVTCEHLTRRVTRIEIDGSISVIAEKWNGKRLNSPNHAVVGRTIPSGSPTPPTASTPTTRTIAPTRRSMVAMSIGSRQIRRGHRGRHRYGSPQRHRLLA